MLGREAQRLQQLLLRVAVLVHREVCHGQAEADPGALRLSRQRRLEPLYRFRSRVVARGKIGALDERGDTLTWVDAEVSWFSQLELAPLGLTQDPFGERMFRVTLYCRYQPEERGFAHRLASAPPRGRI